MDNASKLWLARIALASKILFHIAIFCVVLFGASYIKEYQKWNDHSNRLINEIEIARNQFQSADYTGRNRNLSGSNQADIEALRAESLASIGNLKKVVSDNPKQVKNLGDLETAIRNRFITQDEQYQSLKREMNTITYTLDTLTKGTFYLESVESLFAEIKLTELNILRLERSPKIFQSQWTTIYVLLTMIVGSFAVTVYLNVVLQRNLITSLLIGRLIRKQAGDNHDDEKFIKVPKTDIEKWIQDLQGG